MNVIKKNDEAVLFAASLSDVHSSSGFGLRLFPHRLQLGGDPFSKYTGEIRCCLVIGSSATEKIRVGDILVSINENSLLEQVAKSTPKAANAVETRALEFDDLDVLEIFSASPPHIFRIFRSNKADLESVARSLCNCRNGDIVRATSLSPQEISVLLNPAAEESQNSRKDQGWFDGTSAHSSFTIASFRSTAPGPEDVDSGASPSPSPRPRRSNAQNERCDAGCSVKALTFGLL
jgi:hypothetical protein